MLEEIIEYFQNNAHLLEKGVSSAERVDTHISIVLLTPRLVYKFKKPVDFGFIKQTQREQRLSHCQKEVYLNRRLAEGVYLGTKAIVKTGNSFSLVEEVEPSAIDYCVVMKRLPDSANLLSLLETSQVNRAMVDTLASLLAGFHLQGSGDINMSALHQTENFQDDNIDYLKDVLAPEELETLKSSFQSSISQIKTRRKKCEIVDGHGDLRLDHIYFIENSFQIIDCIEFNDQLRAVDPLEDIAFITNGFRMAGYPEWARAFSLSYFSYYLGGSRSLLSTYEIYRACVRAKIDQIQLKGEVSKEKKQYLQQRFNKYISMSIESAEEKMQAPSVQGCVYVVLGLPATGKSTIARGVAFEQEAIVINSDRVRKKLQKVTSKTDLSAPAFEGDYAPSKTSEVYSKILAYARHFRRQGFSVVLDATYSSRKRRDLVRKKFKKVEFILCTASEDEIRKRLKQRETEGQSISDMKSFSTWLKVKEKFEPPDEREMESGNWRVVNGT